MELMRTCNIQMGDSGENCAVCPMRNVLKNSFAFSKRGIIIKYQGQLKFIYYHTSGDKNICQGKCKFGIIRRQLESEPQPLSS